jgi:putative ABC transport system permease protein
MMTRVRSWFVRLTELVRRRRLDEDLGEELELHLDLLADELVRGGMTRERARAAARRELGGLDRTRQAVRDQRGFRVLDALGQDTRLALRLLRKSPAFTSTAVLTLALGIGANAAIFSLVDGVMLRPLPYPRPEQLIALYETVPADGALGRLAASGGPAAAAAGAVQRIAVAPANLAGYAQRTSDDVSFAYYVSTGRTLTGAGTPERLTGEEISASYLDVLGVAPVLGRPFQPEDYAQGSAPVVIVSDALWRERLGGAADPLGSTLMLDDVPHRLVGVMPAGFQPVTALAESAPVSFLTPAVIPADMLAGRGEHIVQAIGRLAPGASIDAVEDAVAAVAAAIARSDPRTGALGVALEPLGADEVRDARPLLLVLLSGVALVLLAACANVASLLVVRSISRRREVAVRVALGASRARVLLELAVQSLVLAALGGLAGLALGVWLTGLLVSQAPATLPRLDEVALNGRTLLFTGAVALVTALVFGALPAWQVRRARPFDVLNATSRSMAGFRAQRSRSALLFAEVALSMVLVIGAGLMVRSLMRLNAVDLGFDPVNVIAANVALPAERYATPESRLQFFEAVAERVAAAPGVESVAFGNRLPLRGNWSSGLQLEPAGESSAAEAGDPLTAGFQAVGAAYFETFRIRVVSGRGLTLADRDGAPHVAVVSEEFARAFLGGANPIGRRFRRFEGAPWVEVVGVASDLRRGGRTAAIEPQVYLPAAQTSLYPLRLAELAVRVSSRDVPIADSIRAAVWSIDPDQPLGNVRMLEETLSIRQADITFQALLFLLFAALALTLAVIGIYGVVSFAVAQRATEIGLRMALGASSLRVVGATAAQVFAPVACGAGAGAVLAWSLSRYIESRLFGVAPTDPLTYALAAAILASVALASSAAAARRAARVDPAIVLR